MSLNSTGNTYLVEMKWVKEPIGTEKISQHLVRLFSRAEARGIFIASNGYADTAITHCREALGHKVIVLINLREIILLLERKGDLVSMLRQKIQAAQVEKNPFVEILV